MEFNSLLNKRSIFVHVDFKTKDEVLRFLSHQLMENNFVDDEKKIYEAFLFREELMNTAIGDGIAICQALSSTVKKNTLCILTLNNAGISDWIAEDEKNVNLVFALILSKNNRDLQIDTLQMISILSLENVLDNKILASKSVDEIYEIINKFNVDMHQYE
ncbi:PTS sugar transporter subunit IIA [Mycoplasmopsis caviae]|uniref:PTS sugar transporter subunit IIA n=1 Tax=Mycoplasmopsis caviae TaxID=55603 RepID=A0A3P8KNG0_9BACT|nr:PTS sugar transporter subunit IIA [Mycoplasmopsis caviae]UUD34734.1 PTS sugar transporter subunit IIA [Mycoplasmopsis caviae]VDR42428.1 PTS system protein [Mycoplasmopsis caviae]